MSFFAKYYFSGRMISPFHPREPASFGPPETHEWRPPADVMEFPRGWIARVELAGVAAGDVRVRVSPRSVTVEGVRRPWCPPRGARPVYRQMELMHGFFTRTLALPGAAQADAARAALRDGLLEITLPKAETEPSISEWVVVALA